MFEISNNFKNTITNKVIFVKNKVFIKKPNKLYDKKDLELLNVYSDRINQKDVTLIEINKNKKLYKLIVINEKNYSNPFEFQNLGGKVKSLINNKNKLLISFDTLNYKKKDIFITNFLLGFL